MSITQKTSCMMDCPDTCALEVKVTDGRIQSVTGRKDHPDTAGFICSKVGRFARRVYHEDRLLYPMRRNGPKGSNSFARISWEEAIGEITSRFSQIRDAWGAEAILPYHYGGSNGLLSEDYLDRLFFCRLGASRLDKTICAAPATAARVALYGGMRGMAYEDFAHAKVILIWGANTRGSNIHLLPYIRQARKAGAFVVSIDPVRQFSDGEVNLHLGVRPGTDLALALALIQYWEQHKLLNHAFIEKYTWGSEKLLESARAWSLERAAEVCRIPVADIELLARTYAEADTAALRCGWGLERNLNGARAVAAIIAIPSLLGKFGRKGSGFLLSNSSATSFKAESVLGPMPESTRLLNMSSLPSLLLEPLDPPVKALFVYNSNPVATSPGQDRILKGLAREDLFTVVFDQVHTDTAAWADILLPATTFMEHWDLRKAYGSLMVGAARPTIEACGEARSNGDVFATLGRAMGFEDEAFTWDMETHFHKVAESIRLNGAPADGARLKVGEIEVVQYEQGLQFVDLLPSGGKVQLCPESFGPDPYQWVAVESEPYPLALISPASPKLITSTFGEFNLPRLTLTMNPLDATARDIKDGALVRIFNQSGEVRCQVEVTEAVAAGTVMMPKGAWRKASANGKTSVALCPEHLEPISGGACFHDARVEVGAI